MPCDLTKPVYSPNKNGGLNFAASLNDGYTIALRWDRAYPSTFGYNVSYNIYYSTQREDVFDEGVKYVSVDDGYTQGCVFELSPGDTYYFAVRATEYDPDWVNLNLLQDGFPDLKVYTEGILLSDITDSSTTIPVSDIELWPAFGVVEVGTEWIRYSSKDIPSNSLIVSERGFLDTNVRLHQTDGYDGVDFRDPVVRFWKGMEDGNMRVQQETAGFAFPNHAYTTVDGYATQADILTTKLDASDSDLSEAPRYDGVGWHRTNPTDLLSGKCIGTYYGGEQWCADGYGGVGRQLRGVSLEDQILRREEVLLEALGGQPCMLVKRLYEGVRCPCVKSTTNHPSHRCTKCFNTGFVTGYEQFYNPRRSDSRIMVRFGPTEEDIKVEEAGLENTFIPDCWTLGYPSLTDRDFLIRFDIENNEEFRYEILNVTRNVIFNGASGAQKFRARRVRKTEPLYQWRAFRDTSTMPQTIGTTVGLVAGPNGTMIPHTHQIVINEGIVSLGQINQTTSVGPDIAPHNHSIVDGVVQSELGHTHTIVLP